MVFEYQIINEYIELGYEVKWNALLREKDNGIDLIAKNKDTLIFIQCKNHSNEPNQKDIRAFFADSIWKKYFIDRKKGDLSKYEKLEIVFIYSNKTDNSISNWVKYHRQFNYENTKIDVYEKCIEWDSKKYHMNYKIPEFNPDKWISKKDMNNN